MLRLETRIRNAMQCQGERDYLGWDKDCHNYGDKFLCKGRRTEPFKVSKENYVFAETEEQARCLTKRDRTFATNTTVTKLDVKKVGNTLIIKVKED